MADDGVGRPTPSAGFPPRSRVAVQVRHRASDRMHQDAVVTLNPKGATNNYVPKLQIGPEAVFPAIVFDTIFQ